MGKFTLYCHTNKLNGKKYIGVTSQKLNRRFRDGKGYGNCTHFKRAIDKYGWDSFETEILFEGLTHEEAELLEVKLIDEYCTLSPNGYNLESGGNLKKEINKSTRLKISRSRLNSTVGCREVIQYDMDYNFIKKWESIASVGRALGIDSSTIRKVCNRVNHHGGGYIWRYADDVQFTEDEIKNKTVRDEWKLLIDNFTERGTSFTRRVKCITTGIIFDSIAQGAEFYNTDASAISKVCRGKLKSSGTHNGEKLVWGYVD